MITIGVTGQPWRASVTDWGSVEPWDAAPLGWYIAADDRWHIPAEEAAVRQRRVDGTAVVETRVRVPSGDVVQRIYCVADAGGMTMIEVENESTMPVAVAFDRRDLLTDRPITDVPIEGIDLPDGSFAVPIGHRASIRIALPHDRARHPSPGSIPSGVSSVTQVVRGWTSLTERAGRMVLPDGVLGASLVENVTAERCEVALGQIPRASDDAAGFVLALDQLVRMGEPPDHWMPELVDAVERLGPLVGWDADVALTAAGRVLHAAGERRALADLAQIAGGRSLSSSPSDPLDGVRLVSWLESLLVTGGRLLPGGFRSDWLGQPLEVYGLPTAPGSAVSYAIRWHGERPAVLWEQTGEPVELRAPIVAADWSTTESSGEALWPVPDPRSAPSRVAAAATSVEVVPDEPGSFS